MSGCSCYMMEYFVGAKVIERDVRVAFIGISNWALDPAKMNRGVMVTRGTPDITELRFSAKGICGVEDNDSARARLEPYFENLAQAYEMICHLQEREFFGLRDFYRYYRLNVYFFFFTSVCYW